MTKAKSLIEAIQNALRDDPKAAILIFGRHGSYLMDHILGRYPSKNAAFAANYAEVEPPCLFLLDNEGIAHSRWQGAEFALGEIDIQEIVVSHQGRGPDTGIRVAEGYAKMAKRWPQVRCDKRADYPRYNYEQVLKCLDTVGDAFVAQWLNGKHPGLVREPTFQDEFVDGIDDLISEMLAKPGVRMVWSHFENITWIHGSRVDGKDLGEISETWFPKKSGGVCIIRMGSDDVVFDFNPDLTLT